MATTNITAIELDKLIKMKNEGRIAEAWDFLGSKRDAYAFLAGAIVSDNTADMSPIARLFYEMVRSQWQNTVGAGVWGGQVFMDVGKQHLENYLTLFRDGRHGGSGAYVLPDTIEIETSYKAALAKFGLPPITAIDSLFSVIDLAAGNGNGSVLAGDFSWAQFMDVANDWMNGPAWQSDRIVFNSEVFKDDIDPVTAVVTFGRTLINTLEAYGAQVAGVIPTLAPYYWAFKLVDDVLDYTMFDFARSNAVHVLLRQLDTGIEKSATDRILDASSNDDRAAFGLAIDQLAKMLGVSIPASNGGAAQVFDNVQELADSDVYQALVGKVILTPAPEVALLESQSKTDFGAFLALYTLSPVVISTSDGNALAVLKAAHGGLAADWQTDMNARLYGDTDHDYCFSEQWYEDRAAMLHVLMLRNEGDYPQEVLVGGAPVAYVDLGSGTVVELGLGGPNVEKPQVIFGSDAGEIIGGGQNGASDHFYGGNGNDTLKGLGGNDYLEGNAGNDVLNGGLGRDSLIGGMGNDALNGGMDNDTLVGGQGFDRYVFAGAFGADVVVDSDGRGTVWIDGVQLTGGAKLADNVWASDDMQWQYLLQGSDLWIRSAQGASRSILLTGWNSMGGNRLGLMLSDEEAQPAEQSRVFLGDQRAPCEGSIDFEILNYMNNKPFDWSQVSWAANGVLTNGIALSGFSDVIQGSSGGDRIEGLAGSDALDGGAGNDLINGGADGDFLAGGVGSDTILGGDGTDFISSASSITIGRQLRPMDRWYAPGVDILASGPNWGVWRLDTEDPLTWSGMGAVDASDVNSSDWIEGGAGDDWVIAGWGNDYLDGGLDSDTLFGLAGDDIVMGGLDGDILWGDGSENPTAMEFTPEEFHGNDFLVGGDGDDTLHGQGKNDTLLGGDGYDELLADYSTTVTINDGDDWLDGGADNDRLWAGGGADVLYGGDGDDHLWGDGEEVPTDLDGDDLLDGGAGNDYMWGNGGRDTLLGGTGADRLWGDGEDLNANDQADYLDGGEGDDTLVGSLGDDTLWGGAGNDRLSGDGRFDVANTIPTSGSDGNDYLNGEEGDDELVGGGGNDTLLGGLGSDYIWGDGRYDADFGGNDSIEGGGGTDHIFAGSGQDTVRGGDDDDVIFTDGVDGGDLLFGGDGNDNIHADADAAHADSGASTVFGGAGDDWISARGAAHQVYGNEGNDTVYVLSDPADTVAVSIYGGSGDDYVYAVGAAHVVDAGEGDDLVFSVEGSLVHVFGYGYGHDTLIINDYYGTVATPDVIRLGNDVSTSDVTLTRLGERQMLLSLTATGDSLSIEYVPNADVGPAASGVGRIEFSDGTVWDAATIESIRNTGKQIVGTNENDLLNAPASDDTLIGGGGNDTLNGGEGNDTLNGGAGADRLIGGTGDDVYYVNHTGDRTVELANEGHDVVRTSISWTLGANLEELVLMGGASANLTGNALSNRLQGNAGNNLLQGRVGADTIVGGAGSDTLVGGLGNDVLNGGSGADVYLFDRGDMRDAITDNDATAGVSDLVQFGSGISVDQLWFTRFGNHLDVSIIGTSDRLRVNNWYLGERYQIEAFSSTDGQTLTNDRVDDLVDAMSAYSPPTTGQTQLPETYAALVGVIDASWV